MLRVFLVALFLMQFPQVQGKEKNMSEYLDFDVSWGGYYAGISKDSNEISVFRLIDFNRNSYHIALYKEEFSFIPTKQEIQSLSLFIGHAPMDSRGLLNYKKIVLIDSKQLTKNDLVGYMYYLEEFNVSEESREELSQSLISYSSAQPLKLRLSLVGDELQLIQRQ